MLRCTHVWIVGAAVTLACGESPSLGGPRESDTGAEPGATAADEGPGDASPDPEAGSRGHDGGGSSAASDDDGGSGSGGASPPPPFVDVTVAAGLDIDHGPASIAPNCLLDDVRQPGPGDHCLAERALGSVSVGDYDGDGWPDVYLGSLLGPGHVLHNEGDGTFTDVTDALGITGPAASGAGAWVDVDNDGDLELAIAGFADARDYLFVNEGSGAFVEDAVARGFADEDGLVHVGVSLALGDYDLDGWTDMFVGEWRYDAVIGSTDSHARLLHNLGGVFEDVTEAMEIDLRAREALNPGEPGVFVYGPAFVDLDLDRFPDLVLTSDFQTSLLLWNKTGTLFLESTLDAGVGDERHGMGAAFGDIDGDGDLDYFATAIHNPAQPNWGNRLYLNDGDRTFTDVTDLYGVRAAGWGWGAAMFDHDHDRDLEIVMAAGWPASGYAIDPMRFYESGAGMPCEERAGELGLDLEGWGRALVTFDYDRDGDLDVLVATFSEPPVLYRNDASHGDFLAVQLVGSKSNRQGIGARVRVQAEPDAAWIVREIGVGSHLMGHAEALAHFGLGDVNEVHRVEITWPVTGQVQVLGPVAKNQVLTVHEP